MKEWKAGALRKCWGKPTRVQMLLRDAHIAANCKRCVYGRTLNQVVCRSLPSVTVASGKALQVALCMDVWQERTTLSFAVLNMADLPGGKLQILLVKVEIFCFTVWLNNLAKLHKDRNASTEM